MWQWGCKPFERIPPIIQYSVPVVRSSGEQCFGNSYEMSVGSRGVFLSRKNSTVTSAGKTYAYLDLFFKQHSMSGHQNDADHLYGYRIVKQVTLIGIILPKKS